MPLELTVWEKSPAEEPECIERLWKITQKLMLEPRPVATPQRGFHRKTHAVLAGQWRIAQTLPFADGVFVPQRNSRCVLRFSNAQGSVGADAMPAVRGLSLKIIDDGSTVQNFTFVNAARFPFRNLLEFTKFLENLGESPLAIARFLLQRPRLLWLFVSQLDFFCPDLLHSNYASVGSHLIGGKPTKIFLRPLQKRAGEPSLLQMLRNPNFLSENLMKRVSKQETGFALSLVQLKDPVAQSSERLCRFVEDLSLSWQGNEFLSFDSVGTVDLAVQSKQILSSELESDSFNPWVGCHRPLGQIMRARNSIYTRALEFRRAQSCARGDKEQREKGVGT